MFGSLTKESITEIFKIRNAGQKKVMLLITQQIGMCSPQLNVPGKWPLNKSISAVTAQGDDDDDDDDNLSLNSFEY